MSNRDNQVTDVQVVDQTVPSDEDILKAAIKIVRDAGFEVVIASVQTPTTERQTDWVSHAEIREYFSTLKVGTRELSKTEIARILNLSVSSISTVTADSEDGANRHWSRQNFERHQAKLNEAVAQMNRLQSLLS